MLGKEGVVKVNREKSVLWMPAIEVEKKGQ
jgi:hypothetical protein